MPSIMPRILDVLMVRDELTAMEAAFYLDSLRADIAAEDMTIQEALEELGLEDDYIFDLIPTIN